MVNIHAHRIMHTTCRYDLLCEEGLARALRIFLGVERPPVFRAIPAKGAAVRFNVKQKVGS